MSNTTQNKSFSEKVTVEKKLTIERTFTTEPKMKRLTWHKQDTVKKRAIALMESFYPTTDIHYSAVVSRMASLLGIVDRCSVVAYLGRPFYKAVQEMDQTVRYPSSQVNKHHKFLRSINARKGYIETFGFGYCYKTNEQWFIHWNHTEQLTLPNNEDYHHKVSIENISLTPLSLSTINIETVENNNNESRGERNIYGKIGVESTPTQLFSPNLACVKPRNRSCRELDKVGERLP